MDVASIVATSGNLARLCFSLSKFLAEVKSLPTSLRGIKEEISTLFSLLETIEWHFSHDKPSAALCGTTTHEAPFWNHLLTSMKHCKRTLEKLEKTLEPVRREGGPIQLTWSKMKMDWKSTDIETLRRLIQSYKDVMSLSLVVIGVFRQASNQQANSLPITANSSGEIAKLRLSVHSRHEQRQPSVHPDEDDETGIVCNFQACFISAQSLVHAAGSQIGSGDSQYGPRTASLNGVDYSSSRRSQIESDNQSLAHHEPLSTPRTSRTSSMAQDSIYVEKWLDILEVPDQARSEITARPGGPPPSIFSDLKSLPKPRRSSTGRTSIRTHYQSQYSPEVKTFMETDSMVTKLWADGRKEEAADFGVSFLRRIIPHHVSQEKWNEIESGIVGGNGCWFAETGQGFTVLHLFASLGLDEYIAALFGKDINIDTMDRNDCTPLHYSSWTGHLSTCELLIRRGARTTAKSKDGCTPLHVAAKKGQTKILKVLVDSGAETEAVDKDGETPLCYACKHGHRDSVEILLERGAEIEVKSTRQWTPLHYACQDGSRDTVELLLCKGANHAFATKPENWTPLHIACRRGDADITELLINSGASSRSRDNEGRTPLHLACRNGWGDVVDRLLCKGADAEAKAKHGRTPLHTASEHGQCTAAKLLIERDANVEARDNDHRTPLYIACRHGQYAMVDLLISEGAAIGSKKKDKYTPLHASCEHGFEDVVGLLLDKQADVNAKASDGATPLYCASKMGHDSVVRLLLERKGMGLLKAEAKGNYTALHAACQYTRLSTVQLLIDKGADIGAKDKNGRTPLRVACEYARTQVAEVLLTNGANPDTPSKYNYTPLHSACTGGHLPTILLLIERGAKIEAKTIKGESPLSIATARGHTAVVAALNNALKSKKKGGRSWFA